MRAAFFDALRPSRAARSGAVLGVVVGVWLALGSASALASAEPHQKVGEFGSFSNPNGIAIDESSGDVYVADIATSAVYKFDASGNPVDFSALGSNALTGSATPATSFSFPNVYGTPASIAVDNSTSSSDPSAGDLYVLDAGHDVVDKFSSSGAYLGQITGPFQSNESMGVGVDAKGDVRIAEVNSKNETGESVFDDEQPNDLLRHLDAGNQTGQLEHGFAVDPAGDAFQLYGPSACGCVRMYSPNMEGFGYVDNNAGDVAVAVDPATGHVYTDDQTAVSEWDPGDMNGIAVNNSNGEPVASGALVSSFGSFVLSGGSGQGGIAVNGSSGEIYVSNPADGKVYVFASADPAVVAGAPTDITKTSATLHGTVNPRGGAIGSCWFEFGTSGSYGGRVQCDQTPAQIGSGTNPVAVSAHVAGLAAGVLYHFRLQASSGEVTGQGSGLFAAAKPGFGIKELEVAFVNRDGTPDTQAGSHPYKMVVTDVFNTAAVRNDPNVHSLYKVEPDGNFKEIITDFPPGVVADPNATAKRCTLQELVPGTLDNNCPPESIVGELEVQFGQGYNQGATLLEPVFSVVPPPGVPLQLAAHFLVPNAFIDVGIPAGGDYGGRATVINAPVYVPVVRTRFSIYGVTPAEPHKPFITLPTVCNGPLTSTVKADSYQEPGVFQGASSVSLNAAGVPGGLTGCAHLLFPPTISVAPDVPNASSPSGLTVDVHVSQRASFNPEGLAESTLRDTTVALPEGVTLNAAGADGLGACSEGLAGFTGFTEFKPQYEPGVKTATFTEDLPEPLLPGSNFCPDGSKIGTVKITTPLLKTPLEGSVFLATQNANPFGSLVAMYMIVSDPVSGSIVKLTGEVKLSSTGQIVTTFHNTPPVPFEDLELHFFGGERAPLSTPSHCGTYTTDATFTPWDGNGPVETSSSFAITSGPNGSACPGQRLPFNPELTAGSLNLQAGAFTPFTMTMSRADGQQNLDAIRLQMPPGLLGTLSNVKLCDEAHANAGTCAPQSEIGETVVSVGVGGHPYSVRGGKVFITGPYRGAPYGLSIVNPAKAGPYDLGNVVVRAKVEVDPTTAFLTITTDTSGPYQIPTIIDGIPLQIQHVNVTINRPDFTFNPTNCEPQQITGSITSAEGATSALHVPFQVTNCAVLKFKPRLTASTNGKTSRARGASLNVKLTYPPGSFGKEANIRSVKVDLPRQLPSFLATLQHACPDSTFNQNPAACPSRSIVGTANATTPILPVGLSGPAYFVSHGGAKFPELVIVLSGYGTTVYLHGETFISKGVTSSTFRTIPDVPVGSFELKLPQGSNHALAANGNLCTSKLRMPTMFTAQNGIQIHQNTHITPTGCAKHKRHKHRKRKHKKHHKKR